MHLNLSYRLLRLSKRFKKLTIYGCPECIGLGFLSVYGEKVQCKECKGQGTFKLDPNPKVSVASINEQINKQLGI